MKLTMDVLFPIFSLFLTLVGLLIIWVQGIVKTRERIVALETKIEIFWKNVAFDNAKILHTPHPKNARRDELLEKFVEEKFTKNELKELVIILQKIIVDNFNEFGERTAASQLFRTIAMLYEINGN